MKFSLLLLLASSAQALFTARGGDGDNCRTFTPIYQQLTSPLVKASAADLQSSLLYTPPIYQNLLDSSRAYALGMRALVSKLQQSQNGGARINLDDQQQLAEYGYLTKAATLISQLNQQLDQARNTDRALLQQIWQSMVKIDENVAACLKSRQCNI